MKKGYVVVPIASVMMTAQGIAPGIAQEVAPDAPYDLGEIIVGARLFDEAASTVPGSLSVVFAEDLAAPESADLGDITAGTPNVTFQKSNSDERLIIRGISAYPNALADPVGVKVNGVALPLGTMQAPTPIALDQATVLVGPQGAHYGRNSEAGLVSLELAAPGAEDQTRLSFTGASPKAGDQTYIGSLLLNRNLGNFGLVFALEGERSDSPITNPTRALPSNERLTGYAGLGFETDAGTTIELTHVFENEDGSKEQFRYADGPFATERFQSNYGTPSLEERKSNVTSLRIKHRFDWAEFTSITGLTGFDRNFELDFDTSPLPLGVTQLALRDRNISQEFRLTSLPERADALKWSAGASFYKQDTDVVFDLGAFSTKRETTIEQTGAAIFGFAEYQISERLRLGAGARLDHVSSSGAQVLSSPRGTANYSVDQNATAFLPKLTVAYDLTDQTLIYGSVARGYLAGGYNYNFANSAANFAFDPEYTTTAEIGMRFNGARSVVEIAAFYSDITDKQIVETVPGGAQKIENAAAAKAYGIEAKLDQQISDHWSLQASAGWQRATATSFRTSAFSPTGPVPVDYSGNKLPFSPDLTYSLGARYDQANWFGALSVNGSNGYFFDAANTLKQSAFATVDARIGWRSGGTEITLWANNLFDADYVTASLRTPRGTLVEDGAGRRIGLTLTKEW